MKKIAFLLLLLVQQAYGTIINYTCLLSPDGKRKIHLFADMHTDAESSKHQINYELIGFFRNNRNAIFYLDGYHAIDYQNEQQEFYQLQIMLRQSGLIDAQPLPFSSENVGLQHTLFEFTKANRSSLKQALTTLGGCAYSPLRKLKEILLAEHIKIKNDERFSTGNQADMAAEFDGAILNDCLSSTTNVIVFAGIAHIVPLEETLIEQDFNLVLTLKNGANIFENLLVNSANIQNTFANEFERRFHDGNFYRH